VAIGFKYGVTAACLGYLFALCLPAYAAPLAAQNTEFIPENPISENSGPETEPEKVTTIATVYATPFDRVWRAILTEAGIPFKTTKVVQGRRRRMFVDGFITLDCCFNPSWRNRAEEQVVQLFTDSFHVTEIRYVFKKGNVIPIPSPEHLKNLRFAIVRGFTYTLEDYFGETIAARFPGDALRLVELGRAQLTEASRVQFEFDMAKTPRNLELGDISSYTNLHARVHISRADLLPRLNAAIAKLKKNGRIREILNASIPN